MHILNTDDEKDNKSNINELLFTKLSLASLKANEEDITSNLSQVLNKIENDKSKEISTALRIFIGNYSFDQLNEEIQNYTDVKERIKLYRYWIENTKENDKMHFVITNIITEIINSNSDDFFNMEVLSYISKYINKIPEEKIKIEIAKKFSTLLNEVEDNGLFINKTSFKLNIFDCYYDYNHEYAIDILIDLLNEIESYSDLLTKCEALILIIEYIDKKQNYLGKFKTTIFSAFEENFNNLLLETSDQFTPFKRILKSLSKTNFNVCEKYLNKLNTIDNRDKSRLYIIDQYLEDEYKNINLDSLMSFSEGFHDIVFKNIVSKLILERFSTAEELKSIQIDGLKIVINSIDTNLISRTNLIYLKTLHLTIILNNSKFKKNNLNEIVNLKKNIISEIDLLSDNYKKNEFCQIISSRISSLDKKFAREIYSKTCSDVFQFNDLRFKISILLIMSFEAMLTGDLRLQFTDEVIEEKFNDIVNIILSIDDNDDKIELLTRLGFVCYIKKAESHAKYVYEKIFETFSIFQRNNAIYNYINTLSFIYLYNNSYINKLNTPSMIQEDLYFSIAKFYLYKKNPYTVYESNDKMFNCTFTDVSNSLTLIEMLNTDVKVYHMIECISNLIDYKSFKITNIQKNDIVERINTIIENKFLDGLNIKHDGYKIASKIKFHKFSKKYDLQALKDQIDQIPNISDKVYVLTILLEDYFTFRSSKIITKDVIFNEIINGLNQLTNNYEFISRVNDLTDTINKSNLNSKWKDLLSLAYNLSINLENKVNSITYQKKLIDTIYKIDENLAKELVDQGVENSHKTISSLIKKHYNQVQDIKLLGSKESIDVENIERINTSNFIKSSFVNLKNLNSNLITAKKFKDLRASLLIASKIPLEESIVIYDTYFKNISLANYSKAEKTKVEDIVLSNFEAIKNSFSIIDTISKIHESIGRNNLTLLKIESNNVIIKETERIKALNIFRDWIIEEAEDFVYIIDPYFEVKDTEILNIIHKADKGLEIKVLCCSYFTKDNFNNEWKNVSKEELDDCEFIFSYFKHNNKMKPLHDRFLLSKNSGLRLGTSINSIGASNKFSEISRMSDMDVNTLLSATLNDYLNGTKKEVNGERLSRERYYLD